MAHPFYIVDVFAEQPYAGNPLAVVVGADDLSDERMQRVAAETNYSETTFVTSAPEHDRGYRVRIFTPAREIAFAGHPILGTAWVVRNHVEREASGPVRLNLALGQVPVTFESCADGREVAWFLATPVLLGATCARERIAPALGVLPEDIETRVPVQQLSAGTSALIVPLRSLEALRRSRLDLGAFAPLAAEGFPPLVYLFCSETHHRENDLCARTLPRGTERHSSAHTSWSIASSLAPICPCGSSKATRFAGHPWCCCGPEWPGRARCGWAAGLFRRCGDNCFDLI